MTIVDIRGFLEDINNLLCKWEAGKITEKVKENINSTLREMFSYIWLRPPAGYKEKRALSCLANPPLTNSIPVLSSAYLETAGLLEINGSC